MKELIFISFLLVVIVAFVVGYLTGKDAVKQKRRRTPLAPDKGDHPAQFSFLSPDVFPPIGDDTTPALCG